ncbi:MAG: type II toxin-antitoxin system RelE/ParE family toxin [Pseudomonadales bacterium]|nr:type II toxin-antitoxin system RelE/ParE family toxin [Pseudomonadales bacterium]
MARYDIQISRTAERQLSKLPRNDQERIARTILTLTIDPYPRGARKLSGYDDVYRVRVGSYRVLYSVSTTTLIVIVLKVGHRKDVYQ